MFQTSASRDTRGWLLDQNRLATPPVAFCHPPGPGYFVRTFRHPDTFTKCGVFSDPIAFLEYAAIHCPRVAVIDILMPAMNGLEVQARLRSASPSTRVIILTSKDDPSVRSRAMEGGAFAFFLKAGTDGELLAA